MKIIKLSLICSLLLILQGCNTMEGLGEDIKEGGEKIERAAKR